MAEGKDEWYVSRNGQRFGPVTFAEMLESAKAGRLEPRTDMVIGGDVSEWKPAGEVDGLFEKKTSGKDEDGLEGDPTGHTPPKDSMAASGSFDFNKGDGQVLKLPGATRLGYFLGITVLPVLLAIGLGKVMPQLQGFAGKEYGGWVALLAGLVPLIVVCVVIVKRLQNLAMHGGWFFAMFVPFLNWWLGYRLFACPPGYAYTKKLDVIGKILAVLYWIGPVAMIVSGIVFAGKIKEMNESGELQELLNKYEQHVPKIPAMPKKPEIEVPKPREGPQF